MCIMALGFALLILCHFSEYSKNGDSGPKKLGLLEFSVPLTGF